MGKPLLAPGIGVRSLPAMVQRLAARRSARPFRGPRAEMESLLEDFSGPAALGGFKAWFEGSEERLRSLTKRTPFQTVLKDSKGRYLQVDHALANECGTPAASAADMTPQGLSGKPLESSFVGPDRTVLRESRVLEIAQVVRHPDGRDHHCMTTGFEIPGGNLPATLRSAIEGGSRAAPWLPAEEEAVQ